MTTSAQASRQTAEPPPAPAPPPPAPAETAGPPGFRTALTVRPFTLLLTAHGLATVAQVMLTMATGVAVFQRTGSGVWTSAVVALGFLPYVLCSGVAGTLADRHSRSRVLHVSFGARVLAGAGLATALPLGAPTPVLVGLAAVAAVLATPSYPALAAATPQLVPDEALPPANALVTGVENATWIAGPGALGLVLATGGGAVVAPVVATVLFALAALLALRVHLARPARPDEPSSMLAETWVGLRTVALDPRVRVPMAVAVLDNFLYGYVVVATLLVANAGLGGTWAAGWLNVGLTAGAFAAMAVTNQLAARARPAALLVGLSLLFAGSVAVLAGPAGLPASVAAVAVGGGCCLVLEVVAVTLLQRACDPAVTARVFGVYDQLNVGAIALGSAIAGPLAARLGVSTSVLLVAGTLALVALGLLGPLRRLQRLDAFEPLGDTPPANHPQAAAPALAVPAPAAPAPALAASPLAAPALDVMA